MQIDLEKISFVVPQGYRDITSYVFRQKGTRHRLEVMVDQPMHKFDTVQDFMEEQRTRMRRAMGKNPANEQETSGTLAGLPARFLSYTLGDKQIDYLLFVAVTLLPGGETLQILYVPYENEQNAQEVFTNIIRTAKLAGIEKSSEGLQKTLKTFTRRSANVLQLDMPTNLRPPTTYMFLSMDEKKQLKIQVYDSEIPLSPLYVPNGEFKTLAQPGTTIKDKHLESLFINGATGSLASATLTTENLNHTEQWAIRQGMLGFSKSLVVTFQGRFKLEVAADLDHDMTGLVNSFSERSFSDARTR